MVEASSSPMRAMYVSMETGDMLCWPCPLGRARVRKSMGHRPSGSPAAGQGRGAGGQERGGGKNDTMGHGARPEPELSHFTSWCILSPRCLSVSPKSLSHTHPIYSTLISFFSTFLSLTLPLAYVTLCHIRFLKSNFIEVWFAYQKSYPFKVYNSIIFWGGNLLNFSSITKIQFCSSSLTPVRPFLFIGSHPTSYSPGSDQPVICFLSLRELPFLDVLYKWNHAKCDLLCLISFP